MHLTSDDLIRLMMLAYRAVDEPGGWDVFMGELLALTDLRAVAVAFRASARDHFRATHVYGIDDRFLLEFNERIARVNPFEEPAEAQPLGQSVAAAGALLPRSEFLRTEYYDWMARMGSDDIVLTLEKTPEGGMVSFAGFSRRGVQMEDHHVELLRTVMPHMFHAMRLSRQLGQLEAERALSREALSRADFGCVFLDERARVDWMNDHARRLLERDDALELVDGELRACAPQARQALEGALQAAFRVGADEVEPLSPLIELARRGGGRAVQLLISPMRPFAHRLLGPTGGAMVLIADPEHVDERFAERLEVLYGLTPMEAEVAQWLLSGASLKHIAEIFGNSVHTVRSHVKSLFRKCGTSSQAELVGVLQRSLARLG